jgi:hypothetical protein
MRMKKAKHKPTSQQPAVHRAHHIVDAAGRRCVGRGLTLRETVDELIGDDAVREAVLFMMVGEQ